MSGETSQANEIMESGTLGEKALVSQDVVVFSSFGVGKAHPCDWNILSRLQSETYNLREGRLVPAS
jgi:hypothetical protein